MRATGVALGLALLVAAPAAAQEGVFLGEADAPAAVFPDADRFERREIVATPALREAMQRRLERTTPSVWEERYVVFRALRGDRTLGEAVLVDEVGKHRPISFVVGLEPDGRIADVAVMAYREAYGGEVRSARFLGQYQGKGPDDPLRTYKDVRNIAGATLSVDAASRAVRKAQALVAALADGAS
jgi:hypothetical protein